MNKSVLMLAAGGIAVLGLGVFAQQQQTPPSTASTKTFNELFVQAAAAGNAFEIETSRLAPEHANSPSIKKFAAMMVEMHTKAQNDLNAAITKGAAATTPSSNGEMTNNNAPNSGTVGPGGSAPGTNPTQPGGNPVAPAPSGGTAQNGSRVGSSSNNQAAKPAAPTYVAMLSPGEQLQLTYLGSLKGAAFDRAYANAQVNAHEGALIVYKLASQRATDSNLKAFATKTVAVVQKHLTDITAISKTLK
jgi:predicted outer membrane protein